MASKKGFMYYLNNPAETAKKLFPFIDVDAMMEDNKKRYEALGVDPEKGKNLMGMALNPLALGTGVAAGKVIPPLTRTLDKGVRAIAKSEKLPFAKSYQAHQRKTIKKDLLSEAGFNRYKSNAISETKRAIEDTKRGLTLFDNPYVQKTLGKTGVTERIKAAQGRLKSLNADLDFINMRGKHGFKDQYMTEVGKSITDTPLNIGYPTAKGYIRGWSGYYTPKGKSAFIDEANVFRPRFKGTGVHELKHASQYQGGGSLTKHGWKQKLERYLDKTRIEDKMGIPGEFRGRAQAKLLDAVNPRPPWRVTRKENWDYLSSPEEISARLSQYRTQPKFMKWLAEKNIYKPSHTRQLESVFPEGNVKEIADKVWGLAPASLMNYANQEK